PLIIRRRHLNFLIGGGKYAGSTCLNLLVDGTVVRTATGPNDQPGGSEQLDWASWDVAEFASKTAVLQVVDRATGGWGHVGVAHIGQGARSRGPAEGAGELPLQARYLHLPVRNDAPLRRVRLSDAGRVVREFDIKFGGDRPDFWVFADLAALR